MGLLFAQNFAELGGNVVLCDINDKILIDRVNEINTKGKGKAIGIVCDVRDYQQVCRVRAVSYTHLPEGTDTDALLKESLKRKVAFVPGSSFSVDCDRPSNLFRLNYSTMPEEKIEKGIKALGEVLFGILG